MGSEDRTNQSDNGSNKQSELTEDTNRKIAELNLTKCDLLNQFISKELESMQRLHTEIQGINHFTVNLTQHLAGHLFSTIPMPRR